MKRLYLKNILSVLVIIVVFVFVIYAVTRVDIVLNQKTKVSDVVSPITALVGVYAIWYQMKRAKDIAEAEFIVNLNTSFVSSAEIKEIYLKLEKSKGNSSNLFTEDDISKIVNYLTFFEAINNLIDRKILKLDMIDDLFAYRFFLIVHNKHVQDLELIKDADYYRNIYSLHNKWTEYRKRKKYKILLEDYSLNRRNKNYGEYIFK